MTQMPWESDNKTANDADGAQSSVENHLRSGAASPAFLLLAPHVKDAIVNKVQAMSPAEQSSMLQRMASMNLQDMLKLVDAARPSAASVEVKKGDSLSKIAKAHGVSLSRLLAANPQIKNPDLIHPGDRLTMPG